jgi:pimeloyl-ACP methyl ester carboxylesterase
MRLCLLGLRRYTHEMRSETSKKRMSQNRLAVVSAVALALAIGAGAELWAENAEPESPDEILLHIRTEIQQLLVPASPELYQRHLRSVLALCEDSVLKLQFAGADRDAQTKELVGYLRTIESGLKTDDARKPETYLAEGRRSLDLARLGRSDGTLQFYAVSLPAHWDPKKAYPLYVGLHGRWSDLPLALVASTFAPQDKKQDPNDDAIIVVPWVRGNSEYRLENGSEPDIWEAIDDVKTFAKLDPDRWYISGHSWGGDDVWAIVLRTPDLWAAAGIMSGDPVSVPRELGLVTNARFVPFYLWQGAKDPVPNRPQELEEFRASLTDVGDPPKVVVSPGVGHMYRPEDAATLQSWLFEHRRHRPNHFSFVIDTPQHRGVWGISIPQKYPLAYFDVEPKVSFECWIENSTVRIQTSNSNRLDVDLGAGGLNMSGTVKVIVNSKQMFEGPVPSKAVSFSW